MSSRGTKSKVRSILLVSPNHLLLASLKLRWANSRLSQMKRITRQVWIAEKMGLTANLHFPGAVLDFHKAISHPVTCLSWDDFKVYTLWLARKTGKHYRLLTEAEWEYIARAGTTTPYWTGFTISDKQANIGNAHGGTLAVDLFQPNPWGFYQVLGNVMEWVEDCYASSYASVPTDGSAVGYAAGACNQRVRRGGPGLQCGTRSLGR